MTKNSHHRPRKISAAGSGRGPKLPVLKAGKPSVYTARRDPSVKPFLRRGELFLGHRAIRKQLKRQKTSADDVRVRARLEATLRRAAGLHELEPTVGRNSFGNDRARIAWQSGGRISTANAAMVTSGGQTVAHTNFMPKKSGRGSTNTRGQRNAHKRLENSTVGAKRKGKRGEIYERAIKSLDTMAHGQQILSSDALTGGIPNRKGARAFRKPGQFDPERIYIAQKQHRQREHIKRRIMIQSRNDNYDGRPPSPLRSDIRNDGTGGDYLSPCSTTRPASPYRKMDGTTEFEQNTNLAHYLTAPGRKGFQGGSLTTRDRCPKCNFPHIHITENNCPSCNHKL